MHWTPENEAILWRTIIKTHLMSFHLDRIIAEWPGDDKLTPQALVEKFETYRDKGGENAATATSSNATTTQPAGTKKNRNEGTGTSILTPPKSIAPTQVSSISSASSESARAHERERENEHIHRDAHGRKRPRKDPVFFRPPSKKRVLLDDIQRYTCCGWRTHCEGYDCGRWHCIACWDWDYIEGQNHKSIR